MIIIKAEIPHSMSCILRTGEVEKTVDSIETIAMFDLDEQHIHDVEAYIFTAAPSAKEKKIDRLLFFATLPFRWIFALADVLPGRWTDEVIPYSAKVRFQIGGQIGSECMISYSAPEDAVVGNAYKRPKIAVSCGNDPTIEYGENTESFEYCYRSHARNAISVIFLAMFLFGILLSIAIMKTNVIASITCGVLLLVLPLYGILVLRNQKRQKARMKASFNAKTGIFDCNT